MAIAIRGTTPGVSSGVGDPTSLTLTGTRQPNANDVLLIVHCNDFYAITNMPTPTVGGSTTGVTAVTNGTADGGASGGHIKAYTYVVGSTGDLTVAVDETGSADEEKALIVYVLSGADTTTPIDVAGNNTGTSASHVAPSISPTSSDAFLVGHANSGGGSGGGSSYTSPGSMTEQYDAAVGSGMTMVGATEQLSASGATGTRTFTLAAGSVPFVASAIAVKTASGAAPPVPDLYVVRSGLQLR